jgi:hypothetical protein
MQTQSKELDELLAPLLKTGWELTNGGKHYKLKSPKGQVISIAGTSSDKQFLLSVRRDIRRITKWESQMGLIVKRNLPCKCGNKDSRQEYEDGSSFCFACMKFYEALPESEKFRADIVAKTFKAALAVGPKSVKKLARDSSIQALHMPDATVKEWVQYLIKTGDIVESGTFPNLLYKLPSELKIPHIPNQNKGMKTMNVTADKEDLKKATDRLLKDIASNAEVHPIWKAMVEEQTQLLKEILAELRKEPKMETTDAPYKKSRGPSTWTPYQLEVEELLSKIQQGASIRIEYPKDMSNNDADELAKWISGRIQNKFKITGGGFYRHLKDIKTVIAGRY